MKKKENKTEKITIRCTVKEREYLEKKAKEKKISLSQYLVESGMNDLVSLAEYKRKVLGTFVGFQEGINEARVTTNIKNREDMIKELNKALDCMEQEASKLWQN